MQKVGDVANQDLYGITGQTNNVITPRTGELRDLGYIEKVGDKKINGRNHTVYRVTELGHSIDTSKVRDIAPAKKYYSKYEWLNICKELKMYSERRNGTGSINHDIVYQTLKDFLATKQ